MLASQRHESILRALKLQGAVRVTELVDDLAVSDMTIRRDLDYLERQGRLIKVHGGATLVGESSTLEPAFVYKESLEKTAKELIAREALKMIKPGAAIALNGGTTTATLAGHLLDIKNITIVTNSMKVAERLWAGGDSSQTVILTGGVRTPTEALVGPVAIENIRGLHVDLLFMGVHGISEKAGYTSPNIQEAETNRHFIAAANQTIVLADHTKWGLVGLSQIAALDGVTHLITDGAISDEARTVLAATVPNLIIAAV